LKYSICVIGLGYVGLVTAVKLASLKNNVIGVEANVSKLKSLNDGVVPFYEPGLDDLFKQVLESKYLNFTNKLENIQNKIDIMMICVGTPSDHEGKFNYSSTKKVSNEIIQYVKNKNQYFLIAMRSTVLPGTTRKYLVDRISAKTKLRLKHDYDVVMNPEFLREGSALSDFDNPERSIVGVTSIKASAMMKDLYSSLKCPYFETSLETAELSKYVDNAWHALKIVFGNEVGALSNKLNIKVDDVYKIFTSDNKLNISKSYLKPGFAFGGSCLPKDVKAITFFNKENSIDTPILNSIMKSNQASIIRLQNLIMSFNKVKISILGLTFKENTNDCRDSPIIEVINYLISKEKKVCIYDNILVNKNYIEDDMFKNYNFSSNAENCITESDIVVITHKKINYIDCILALGKEKIIVDIVGIQEISKMKNYINFN
jgi:GDP-mannose 6-dehydrogenase